MDHHKQKLWCAKKEVILKEKKGLSNFGQLAPLPQTISMWILLSTLKYEFYTREGKIAHIQGVFFAGPTPKVLSMELVPPNKEIDWFRPKGAQDPGLRMSKVCEKWS